jgi:hypothetical protein
MKIFRPHPDVTVLNDHTEIPGLGFLPINAYVLHARQPVVVDTGLGLADRDFVSAVAEVLDPEDVRWIWLTHPDRDHTGGIYDLLEAAPQARVVTTFIGVGILSCERPLPLDRVYLLNPGQSLDVGDRLLTGFRPPLFDNPATVGILDSRSGVAFSSDCFGAPLATADAATADDVAATPGDELHAAQLLWANIDSPWVQKVDQRRFAEGFARLRDFGPSWIFSTHLPPSSGMIDQFVETALQAPAAGEFPMPDQAALEAMLATFEPAPSTTPAMAP